MKKIVGITGEIASGKSYISEMIVCTCRQHYIEAHNMDLDVIAHDLYEDSDFVVFEFRPAFGKMGVKLSPDGIVDRHALRKFIFEKDDEVKDKMDILNATVGFATLRQYERIIEHCEGLILFNSALIAEHELFEYIPSRKVINLSVSGSTQVERMKKRGWDTDVMDKMLSLQLRSHEKSNAMRNAGMTVIDVWNDYRKTDDSWKRIDDDDIKELIKTKIFDEGELL